MVGLGMGKPYPEIPISLFPLSKIFIRQFTYTKK
jgi:hypothetical protein